MTLVEVEERVCDILGAYDGNRTALAKKIKETPDKKRRTLVKYFRRMDDRYAVIKDAFEYVLKARIYKDENERHHIEYREETH